MRVAVVDLGTNSVRLLLGEVKEGRVESSARRAIVTRLGQGVDTRHRLDPAAVERTRTCLAGYAAEIEAFGPDRRLLIATSVLRDVTDGRVFLEAVQDDFRLPWQVLGGEEEAALAFAGAASSSPPAGEPTGDQDVRSPASGESVAAERAADARVAGEPTGNGRVAKEQATTGSVDVAQAEGERAAAELVVIDIGGGSTEFAIGPTGGTPARPRIVFSLDIGVVRVTERFFAGDPPGDKEWDRAAVAVHKALVAGVPTAARTGVPAGIGLAGTFTTLVAHKLALRTYDPTRVHGHVLTLEEIEQAISTFRGLTSAQRAALPGIQRGREDVILAGALIAAEACRLFGLESLRVSEADILDGAALLAAGVL